MNLGGAKLQKNCEGWNISEKIFYVSEGSSHSQVIFVFWESKNSEIDVDLSRLIIQCF